MLIDILIEKLFLVLSDWQFKKMEDCFKIFFSF